MHFKLIKDKYFFLKLLFIILFSITVSFVSNIFILFSLCIFISILYLFTGQKLKCYLSDIRPIIYIFIISSFFVFFFQYISIIELTTITLKMIILISAFSLFIRTTHINNLINFLGKYCSKQFVFVLCISLKFLPLLRDEIKDIYYLQKNRGVKYNFRNIINGSFFLCLIVPFIISCLKIINNLMITSHIKKLDLNCQRSSIYHSEKLKKIYLKDYK